MNKLEAKALVEKMRDYIPGGKPVDPSRLIFRPTSNTGAVHLCGVRTGEDIQSGPYYCGKVADWFATTADGTVAICDRHGQRIGIRREGAP
jgi:hypothetical protein